MRGYTGSSSPSECWPGPGAPPLLHVVRMSPDPCDIARPSPAGRLRGRGTSGGRSWDGAGRGLRGGAHGALAAAVAGPGEQRPAAASRSPAAPARQARGSWTGVGRKPDAWGPGLSQERAAQVAAGDEPPGSRRTVPRCSFLVCKSLSVHRRPHLCHYHLRQEKQAHQLRTFPPPSSLYSDRRTDRQTSSHCVPQLASNSCINQASLKPAGSLRPLPLLERRGVYHTPHRRSFYLTLGQVKLTGKANGDPILSVTARGVQAHMCPACMSVSCSVALSLRCREAHSPAGISFSSLRKRLAKAT